MSVEQVTEADLQLHESEFQISELDTAENQESGLPGLSEDQKELMGIIAMHGAHTEVMKKFVNEIYRKGREDERRNQARGDEI